MVRRCVVTAIIGAALAAPAAAQVAVYSNLAHHQNANTGSRPLWDDATISGGGRLSGFSFWVENIQAPTPRIFNGAIAIHLFDDATGLPNGPRLGAFPVTSGTPINPGEARLISLDGLESYGIDLPDGAKLGVLFTFEDFNFLLRMYDPPTVGSSGDIFWEQLDPSPASVVGRVGNLGFEIRVPSPSGAAAGLLACALATARRRRG